MICFIREATDERFVYIGESTNPMRRVRELQPSNGRKLELVAVEGSVHDRATLLRDRFATAKVSRQWFRPVPELLAYAAALPKVAR